MSTKPLPIYTQSAICACGKSMPAMTSKGTRRINCGIRCPAKKTAYKNNVHYPKSYH